MVRKRKWQKFKLHLFFIRVTLSKIKFFAIVVLISFLLFYHLLILDKMNFFRSYNTFIKGTSSMQSITSRSFLRGVSTTRLIKPATNKTIAAGSKTSTSIKDSSRKEAFSTANTQQQKKSTVEATSHKETAIKASANDSNVIDSLSDKNYFPGTEQFDAPNNNGVIEIDEKTDSHNWSTSFHGLSTTPFSAEISNILQQEINPEDIEIKPGNIYVYIYLPIRYFLILICIRFYFSLCLIIRWVNLFTRN